MQITAIPIVMTMGMGRRNVIQTVIEGRIMLAKTWKDEETNLWHWCLLDEIGDEIVSSESGLETLSLARQEMWSAESDLRDTGDYY
jgi:hypothetical protein